jgi:hypothetical protein
MRRERSSGIRPAPAGVPFTEQATVSEQDGKDRGDAKAPSSGRDIPRGTDEETNPDASQSERDRSRGAKAREQPSQRDRDPER